MGYIGFRRRYLKVYPLKRYVVDIVDRFARELPWVPDESLLPGIPEELVVNHEVKPDERLGAEYSKEAEKAVSGEGFAEVGSVLHY